MKRLHSTALVLGLACLLGFSIGARAGVTIDVVFQDATTPSGITIDAGDPGPGCAFGGYYGGSATTGYCMDVILTTTWYIEEVSVSVAYDSDNGLEVASMNEWGGYLLPGMEDPQEICVSDGALVDNGGIIQSFDCVRYVWGPPSPGTYRLGTIIWDPSGTTPGTEVIQAVFAGGDGMTIFVDGNFVDVSTSVVLGSHLLTIVPEPGTVSLLGLGFVGLLLAARRRAR